MTGPFMISPCMELIMGVVVPWILIKLDLVHVVQKCMARRCHKTIDGDAQQFEVLPLEGTANCSQEFAKPEALIEQALIEYHHKPFVPLDELLEEKLCFLCLIFFAPCKPLIIIPFLATRMLDSHTDVVKLLKITRRSIPNSAKLLHATEQSFLYAAMVFAVLWSLILSLLTYNNDLHT